MNDPRRRSDALEDADVATLATGLASTGTDLPAGLKERVMARAFTAQPAAMRLVLKDEGDWIRVSSKVDIKPLRIDRRNGTYTSLWRLAPGAVLPEHDHHDDEECLILDGSIQWSGRDYVKGDYLLACAGLHHTQFASRDGALLMIRADLNPQMEQLFAGVA